MKFTYDAYRSLLSLLRERGYAVRNYHNYADAPRCVILRHDIDTSLLQSGNGSSEPYPLPGP